MKIGIIVSGAMKDTNHIDGTWYTTEYFYKGYKYLIKSRKGHGIKSHIFDIVDPTLVIKTIRFHAITPRELRNKVMAFIDENLTAGTQEKEEK